MKKGTPYFVVILAVMLIGGYVLYVQKTNAPAQNSAKTGSNSSTGKKQSSNTAPENEERADVKIQNFSFAPATLTVKRGTTVVWTNGDLVPHSIKSDSFASNVLSKGESFSFKFDAAGAYDYMCGIHPSMNGKIIVN